ncbi:unnamed protein product [Mesocestoides corti]|uniref:Endonuclease/exonuclease/phosphatase domain-containing protein n=1 Tax=Mesocestoides corti TaxID=53468 RepID=A0A158QS03_MESCO|nr:unnamed protein product [Mesocestoides corti]
MTPIPTIYSTDVLTTPESFQVRRPNNLNEFTMQSRLMTEEEAKVGKRSEWFRVNLTGPVKNFPRNLCYLTYITTLVIKNNHLERLPPELGNLVNLVNLDASHNRLRVLPPTLGDLTDLRALILNDNQISDLPLEIGRLLNLRHFNLLDNPLNPETGSLYGDGGEPSIRRMIRHFLDCYYQQMQSPVAYISTVFKMHPTDARPPGSADSHRDRSTPQEIASPTRPNSSNWSVLKKVDSTSETDCCSSPDSAVVTGSESLGSSDSVDSLDIIKAESPSTKRNVPSKHRSNRRYRRWCQMRPDLSNSSSSPGSSALTDNKSLDDSTKNAKQHSPIPTAVVRNTLECPVVFPSWSCLPGNASPPCAPYFPTLPHWVHLNWVPHLMPSNGVPLQNPLGSVMVDLTGRDVAYSVERLPPVPQSILKNPYEKISVSPSYPEADQFRGAFAQPFSPPPASSSESGAESTQSRSEINNIVSTPTWHIPPFPSVYIPPPLRIPRALDHCKSLKTCAVPFSEFSHYFNSSPPRRQWRQLGSPSKNGYRLTLMCYNVLSSNYATYSQYPYCPTWAIDWEYRRRGILEELRLYAPNIICLQEIDTDQFETVFVPELAKNNYEGIFLAKSRSRTMEPASARKVDGCAIFWLSEKFTKVTEFRYEFMLSCSNVSEHPSPLLLNRVMTRDNVAIGVVLEIKAPSPVLANGVVRADEGDAKVVLLVPPSRGRSARAVTTGLATQITSSLVAPTSTKNTHPLKSVNDISLFSVVAGNSRRFCVSTGHIHWDPEHSDVKLIQTIIWTAELWSHLDKLCGDSGKPGSGASRMPVVLCGDLNSLPTSGVVEFLSKGCVPTSHVEFLNFGFSYQFEDWKMLEKWAVDGDILRHRFNFDRAYKGGIADGMKITNLTWVFLFTCSVFVIRELCVGGDQKSAFESLAKLLYLVASAFSYDFKGMIDYIFFTRHHFRLLRSLDQIPESWFMEERILGCPHIHVPSDHFSLLVELDLLTQPARGLAISDPSDATGLDNTTTVSAPAPSVTNSPKPKGSAVQRPKQGRR